MAEAIRLLLVEDDDADALLLVEALRDGGFEPSYRRVETAAQLKETLATDRFDAVISDYQLPQLRAPEALEIVQAHGLDLPFLIVSGTIGEDAAIAAMRAGAHDYLMKDNLIRLAPSLTRELREAANRLSQRRALEELRAAEERFSSLVASLDEPVISLDREGRVTGVFGSRLPHAERDPKSLIGTQAVEFLPPAAVPLHRRAQAQALSGERAMFDWSLERDGVLRHYETSLSPIQHREEIAGLVGIVRDVTKRKQVEARLLVSDRLAAVGTLAAGVAHEINNPLASLLPNVDVLLQRLDEEHGGTPPDELRVPLLDIREAAARVRQIVRDLKLFSREGEPVRALLDVREVIAATLRLAGNELRQHARLEQELGPVPRVRANAERLGQVFLNLVINAVQALSDDGHRAQTIRIVTSTDEQGNARIEVSDTGVGIEPSLLRRIFDPFFTTKPVGVGTGLGLSISFGIVKDLGGQLFAESTVGVGTTFVVLLPPAEGHPNVETPRPAALESTRRGRLLVVDDEPLVIKAIRRLLHAAHDVTGASDGKQALELLKAGERYDVVLCDLLMPGLTGMELHAALCDLDPQQAARMVFLTGGAFTQEARTFLETVGNLRLDKPFDPDELRQLIEQVLCS